MEGQIVDAVLALFANRKPTARRNYHQFLAAGVVHGKRDDLTSCKRSTNSVDEASDPRILGDSDFVEEVRSRKELAPMFSTAISITELIRRVSSHCAVDIELMQHKTRAPGIAEARSIICYLAVRQLDHNGAEVGRQLGISRSGVSVAVKRGELLVKNDPEYLSLID